MTNTQRTSRRPFAGVAAIVLTVLLVVGLATVSAASDSEKAADKPAQDDSAAKLEVGGVIARGAGIGKSPVVTLADVLKDPDKFADKPVVFAGTVTEVCQKKGCWMEVTTGDVDAGVRVTFKDYGFFVPKDAQGLLVRAEGVFHTKMWSKEDADHLEGEGAQLRRNADGTATELGFVAAGVELRRAADDAEKRPEKPKPQKVR